MGRTSRATARMSASSSNCTNARRRKPTTSWRTIAKGSIVSKRTESSTTPRRKAASKRSETGSNDFAGGTEHPVGDPQENGDANARAIRRARDDGHGVDSNDDG